MFSQGIKFEENHNLQDAFAQAKSENKLIFIDAYASWCGPCKMMAAKVFPLQAVGDYYNAHFVNLKLDMEAKENIEIAKKYEVKAYPTYLFLNSDGEVVHRALGGMSETTFVNVAKKANDPENNALAITKKLKAGDKSIETLKKYLEINPYDSGNEQLINSFFSIIPDEKKLTKENWELVKEYVDDLETDIFKYILKNRATFETKFGKNELKEKLQNVFLNTYYRKKDKFENLKKIDAEAYQETLSLIAINTAYSQYKQFGGKETWTDLMKLFTPYLNKSEDPERLNNIAWMILENYKQFKDKKSLINALNWAKKAVNLAPDKDHIIDTYAHLLYENGKKKEAVKIETKALEIAQKNSNEEGVQNYKNNIEKFKKQ